MKSIPKYIERLAFIVESLKNDILREFNLTWTDYLVLCLINEFAKEDKSPTPQAVISASGKNRGWIYRAIKKLSEQGYIDLWKGKAFMPGTLHMGLYGRVTLRRINEMLVQRLQEK